MSPSLAGQTPSLFILLFQNFHNLFKVPVVDFSARDIIHPACDVFLDLQATLPQHMGQDGNRDSSRRKEIRQLVGFASNSSGSTGQPVFIVVPGHAIVNGPMGFDKETNKTHAWTALLRHALPNPVSMDPTTPYSSLSSLPHRS